MKDIKKKKIKVLYIGEGENSSEIPVNLKELEKSVLDYIDKLGSDEKVHFNIGISEDMNGTYISIYKENMDVLEKGVQGLSYTFKPICTFDVKLGYTELAIKLTKWVESHKCMNNCSFGIITNRPGFIDAVRKSLKQGMFETGSGRNGGISELYKFCIGYDQFRYYEFPCTDGEMGGEMPIICNAKPINKIL